MSVPILSALPSTFRKGDTVKFTVDFADYPASDGWALAYTFINSAGKFTGTGAVYSGDTFLVTVTTSSATAGKYKYQAVATKSGESSTVATGEIEVLASYADSSTYDYRSNAQRIVDAIDAFMSGHATAAQQEITISGRQIKKTPLADLITARSRYAAILRQEQEAERIAQGLAPKRFIQTRFVISG